MAAGLIEGRLTEKEIVEGVLKWQRVRVSEANASYRFGLLVEPPRLLRDEEAVRAAADELRDLNRQTDVLFRAVFPSIRTRPGTYPIWDLRFKRTYYKHWDGTYQNFGSFPDFYCYHGVEIAGENFSVQNHTEALHIVRSDDTKPTLEITEGQDPLIHLPDGYQVPVETAFSNWNFFNGIWQIEVPKEPGYVKLSPELATEKAWGEFQAKEGKFVTVPAQGLGKRWPR